MDVKIEQSWKSALAEEFGKPYFESLVRFLHAQKEADMDSTSYRARAPDG